MNKFVPYVIIYNSCFGSKKYPCVQTITSSEPIEYYENNIIKKIVNLTTNFTKEKIDTLYDLHKCIGSCVMNEPIVCTIFLFNNELNVVESKSFLNHEFEYHNKIVELHNKKVEELNKLDEEKKFKIPLKHLQLTNHLQLFMDYKKSPLFEEFKNLKFEPLNEFIEKLPYVTINELFTKIRSIDNNNYDNFNESYLILTDEDFFVFNSTCHGKYDKDESNVVVFSNNRSYISCIESSLQRYHIGYYNIKSNDNNIKLFDCNFDEALYQTYDTQYGLITKLNKSFDSGSKYDHQYGNFASNYRGNLYSHHVYIYEHRFIRDCVISTYLKNFEFSNCKYMRRNLHKFSKPTNLQLEYMKLNSYNCDEVEKENECLFNNNFGDY
jgi:hypothetical protein